ncbi:MAG: hypothetical protein Q7V63_05575 [Gammaproteobacteria bacterium]|nr:hypothetical protein [Gammaproteobacteria bacterium]
MKVSLHNKSIQTLLLAGLCSLLAACASTKIQSQDPSISLHPVQVAKQLQISLQLSAPDNPTLYINANAATANGTSSSMTSSNSNSSSTTSNDQIFQPNQPTSTSSTAISTKSDRELYNAKIHSIAALRPQIENILSQYGFVPVAYKSQLQRKLSVQILSLDNTKGLQATIEVDAINGMLTYSRTYTGTSSDLSMGDLNSRSTKLIGGLLTQGLGDSQLISFLTQP